MGAHFVGLRTIRHVAPAALSRPVDTCERQFTRVELVAS